METDTATAPPRLRWRSLLLGIAALAAVLVAGYVIGQVLAGPDDVDLIQPGVIIEVQTDSGRVLVGTYTGGDADYLILADPAELSSGPEGGGVEIRLLRSEPSSILGNALVTRSQVVLIGAIGADSELGRSYLAVTRPGSAPSAEPSPSP